MGQQKIRMPSMRMNNCLDVGILGFREHRYFYLGIGVMEYWAIVPSWMVGGFLFKGSSERASKQASKQASETG